MWLGDGGLCGDADEDKPGWHPHLQPSLGDSKNPSCQLQDHSSCPIPWQWPLAEHWLGGSYAACSEYQALKQASHGIMRLSGGKVTGGAENKICLIVFIHASSPTHPPMALLGFRCSTSTYITPCILNSETNFLVPVVLYSTMDLRNQLVFMEKIL